MTARVSNATSEGFERDERGFRTRRARVSNVTSEGFERDDKGFKRDDKGFECNDEDLCPSSLAPPLPRIHESDSEHLCPSSLPPPSPDTRIRQRAPMPVVPAPAFPRIRESDREDLCPSSLPPTFPRIQEYDGEGVCPPSPSFLPQPSRGYKNATAEAYPHLRRRFCPNLPADTRTRWRRLIPTFAVVSGYTTDVIGIVSTHSHMKTTPICIQMRRRGITPTLAVFTMPSRGHRVVFNSNPPRTRNKPLIMLGVTIQPKDLALARQFHGEHS